MKHNLKISLILLIMFVLTQFIGLYVVNSFSEGKIIDGIYSNSSHPDLPYGMEPPKVETNKEYSQTFISFLVAFVIAILIILILNKFGANFLLKLWFFTVVVLALGISFVAISYKWQISIFFLTTIAIILSYIKTYRQNFLIHNFTELLIYPGIAAIFVPLLNIWTIIILLVLISIYDVWAVWHSGIMQKMAKYQIDNLKVFSGFFVPYASKKVKEKIKKMRQEAKNLKLDGKKPINKEIKVNIAMLGGGDIVFPIITAGVFLRAIGFKTLFGFTIPLASLFVIFGATLGLSYLFFFAEKKKFYPAMPFISAGIFLALILYYLIF